MSDDIDEKAIKATAEKDLTVASMLAATIQLLLEKGVFTMDEFEAAQAALEDVGKAEINKRINAAVTQVTEGKGAEVSEAVRESAARIKL